MIEGQFDQHFMEIFAKGDSAPSTRAERMALRAAALLAVTLGGSLLLGLGASLGLPA